MKPLRAFLLALLCLAVSACGQSSTPGAQRPSPAMEPTLRYAVTLSPLNASGVSGTVRLELTGDMLVVTTHAIGLAPNQTHYEHIHGTPGGAVSCPTAANADASGMVSVAEGLAVVGPIAFDLQPYPQVTGTTPVDWSQRYTLSPYYRSHLTPLTEHVVVLHGLAYQGVYDRALFVACGPILAV